MPPIDASTQDHHYPSKSVAPVFGFPFKTQEIRKSIWVLYSPFTKPSISLFTPLSHDEVTICGKDLLLWFCIVFLHKSYRTMFPLSSFHFENQHSYFDVEKSSRTKKRIVASQTELGIIVRFYIGDIIGRFHLSSI